MPRILSTSALTAALLGTGSLLSAAQVTIRNQTEWTWSLKSLPGAPARGTAWDNLTIGPLQTVTMSLEDPEVLRYLLTDGTGCSCQIRITGASTIEPLAVPGQPNGMAETFRRGEADPGLLVIRREFIQESRPAPTGPLSLLPGRGATMAPEGGSRVSLSSTKAPGSSPVTVGPSTGSTSAPSAPKPVHRYHLLAPAPPRVSVPALSSGSLSSTPSPSSQGTASLVPTPASPQPVRSSLPPTTPVRTEPASLAPAPVAPKSSPALTRVDGIHLLAPAPARAPGSGTTAPSGPTGSARLASPPSTTAPSVPGSTPRTQAPQAPARSTRQDSPIKSGRPVSLSERYKVSSRRTGLSSALPAPRALPLLRAHRSEAELAERERIEALERRVLKAKAKVARTSGAEPRSETMPMARGDFSLQAAIAEGRALDQLAAELNAQFEEQLTLAGFHEHQVDFHSRHRRKRKLESSAERAIWLARQVCKQEGLRAKDSSDRLDREAGTLELMAAAHRDIARAMAKSQEFTRSLETAQAALNRAGGGAGIGHGSISAGAALREAGAAMEAFREAWTEASDKLNEMAPNCPREHQALLTKQRDYLDHLDGTLRSQAEALRQADASIEPK